MSVYRESPNRVEAIHYDGENHDEVLQWAQEQHCDHWLLDGHMQGGYRHPRARVLYILGEQYSAQPIMPRSYLLAPRGPDKTEPPTMMPKEEFEKKYESDGIKTPPEPDMQTHMRWQ